MSLVRSAILEKIQSLAPDGSKNDDQDAFKKALSVTIDTYHVISRNSDSGSLSCGANVSMTFTKPDGKVLQASGVVVPFSIYKAENGSVFSLENTMPLVNLVMSAK
jgi:Asp-tRNA(Asn)/Glu-tRNA(Gln) amidotransferase B subunit